jgi:hypothetical protein
MYLGYPSDYKASFSKGGKKELPPKTLKGFSEVHFEENKGFFVLAKESVCHATMMQLPSIEVGLVRQGQKDMI